MLRGYLPRFGAAEARLSFLHVSDLAQAVSQWLMADRTPVYPYEICDGVVDGYNWQRIQEIAAAVRNRPVRAIAIPLPLLNLDCRREYANQSLHRKKTDVNPE